MPPRPSPGPAPPQALDAEEAVLGALMLRGSALDVMAEEMTADDFYRASHARIFAAASELYARSVEPDALALADLLEQKGELEAIGGRARLGELAALAPATANARHYARIVREMAVLRGLVRAGNQIAALGWDRPGETGELLEQAEGLVFELARPRAGGLRHASEAATEAFSAIQARYEAGGRGSGLRTGFHDLDNLLEGIQPGNLVILAARPSMGKTGLALGVASHVSIRQRLPVAVFSLEMSRQEVMQRLMATEAKVPLPQLRSGALHEKSWGGLVEATERISAAPLYIEDAGLLSMVELRASARRLRLRHPDLALVVVDYLQLMASGTPAENRVAVVTQLSRELKLLARDLDVPVLVLSQLNRAPETRHDHRPMLADLRESGALEQDADLVLFLYRDDYYFEDSEAAGIAELNVAKARNGPTGTVKLAFMKRFARFGDLAPEQAPLAQGVAS